jgi:hypothetical protein
LRDAIVNEEKRRRDHGFKRSVIPQPLTTAEQESSELGEEGQTTAVPVEANEEEEAEDEDEDSSSSDEDDEE